MLKSTVMLAGFVLATPLALRAQVEIDYMLRVDTAELSAIAVELRIRNAPASLTLAAHAHPEYDDKYWRHVDAMRVTDAAGRLVSVTRQDSVLWRVQNPAGDVTVRYAVRFPKESSPRGAWRPFLAPTGGLVGGPHSFLYMVGHEKKPVSVTIDIPSHWQVGTGLRGPSTARSFRAPDVHTLMESPMLVGRLREWGFRAGGIPHRVFYWPLPDAAPFDTAAFLGGVERLASETIRMFGSAPYSEYTFLFQDGAFGGGLEHPNSVTLGAQSEELARDPHSQLREIAHEFVHTWNLMAIKPIEYREVDYRVQPPVPSLWFSEGLTIFYGDLLTRRAKLPTHDSTRIEHLENLVERYLSMPGNAKFSAEQVSRVAYNASPGALGDYSASTHLQGEILGTLLDLVIRDATDGARSMDDVMRLMFTRFSRRGFTGRDIQAAVEEVCSCTTGEIFDRHVRAGNAIDFNRYLAPLGLRLSATWAEGKDNEGRPRRDLRFWAWQEGGEPYLRLRVTDAGSVWGKAGLHTGDQLISVNGAAIRTWPELRAFLSSFAIGETATIVVQRRSGRFAARVMMTALVEPSVRIESIRDSSDRQRRLRAAWIDGRP